MGHCFGPTDSSYTAGNAITIFPEATPRTFTSGQAFRIGGNSTSMPGGGSGFGTRLRFRTMDTGTYYDSSAIPLPNAGAWYMDGTLPGPAGSHPYAAFIWTDGNAYGVSIPGLYFDHASCGPPVYCQYGTKVKDPSNPLVFVTDNFLKSVEALAGTTIWTSLFGYALGQAVDLSEICASMPTLPPAADATWWITPGLTAWEQLKYMLWFQYCECAPGATTPVAPPFVNPPVTGTPPAAPPPVLNPTNPCLSLDEVLRLLRQIVRITSTDQLIDTFVQRQLVPGGTASGAIHAGLTGGGSFAISGAIGVKCATTARPPGGRELEGAPNYVWDLGWLSIMDDNGFIQERRLTRDVEVWMPRLFSDATTFGYFFKAGVTATVTLLHALP